MLGGHYGYHDTTDTGTLLLLLPPILRLLPAVLGLSLRVEATIVCTYGNPTPGVEPLSSAIGLFYHAGAKPYEIR